MMSGKINKKGFLLISNNNGHEYEKRKCPVSPVSRFCGDWCPLFGNPEKVLGNSLPSGDYLWHGEKELKLCNKTVLSFSSLEDERYPEIKENEHFGMQ